MKRILVLCTGNSARSQMAHGYLQHFAGTRAEVFSAGVAPHGVNPLSIQVMAEDGIDISHHTSNHVDEYTAIDFDYVITVCDNAREQCPYFPSSAERGDRTDFYGLSKLRQIKFIIFFTPSNNSANPVNQLVANGIENQHRVLALVNLTLVVNLKITLYLNG